MPKIVIVGSSRYAPYLMLAMPTKLDYTLFERNSEEAYIQATKKFYPEIDKCDIVIVYAPNGVGKHTQRDIDYSLEQGKPVFNLIRLNGAMSGACLDCKQRIAKKDGYPCSKCRHNPNLLIPYAKAKCFWQPASDDDKYCPKCGYVATHCRVRCNICKTKLLLVKDFKGDML